MQNDYGGVKSLLETEHGCAAINSPNFDGLTPLVRVHACPFNSYTLANEYDRHILPILVLMTVQLLSF